MKKKVAIGVLALAAAVLVPVVARGGGAVYIGGIDRVNAFTYQPDYEVKGDQWTEMISRTIQTTGEGTALIQISGNAWAQDYGSGDQFIGEDYAELKMRIRKDGQTIEPGVVTFASNAGAIGSATPRTSPASLQFYVQYTGDFEYTVQVKNINPKDLGGIDDPVMTTLYTL